MFASKVKLALATLLAVGLLGAAGAFLAQAGHAGDVCGLAFAANGRTLVSGSRDTTALLWDLRPPARRRPIEALWADLRGQPEAAYAAVWAMADTPATSIPFLRK